MASVPLDRTGIINALSLLGRYLQSDGLRGDLFVVGGAAMALAYDDRRFTRDVDAIFEPKMRIYELAADVAGEPCLLRRDQRPPLRGTAPTGLGRLGLRPPH